MSVAAFELRVLGPTELRAGLAADHGPGDRDAIVRQPKRLAVLTYLAITTAVGYRRRDQVVGLFWPDSDQAQARTQLRKALYAINEALGTEVFLTRGEDEVQVDATKLWCDAVALATSAVALRHQEALALYRGELLGGLFPEGVAPEFQEWLDDQRRVLRELAAGAAWSCSRAEEEAGDHRAAAALARRALELTPDDEDGLRRLMSLLDRHGDRAGALRVYSDWQTRLLKEYGVEPAPETRKLARRVQAARKGESHETPPTPQPAIQDPLSDAGASSMVGLARDRRGAWRRPRLGLVVIGLTALLLAGAAGVVALRGGSTPSPSSVAVLPLRVIGASEAGTEAARLSEELVAALARQPDLAVRPAGSGADRADDIVDVGRRLRAAWLVDGAVQHVARLRVTLRLVRTSDGIAVWARAYDADTGDVMLNAQRVAEDAALAIQELVAQAAATSRHGS